MSGLTLLTSVRLVVIMFSTLHDNFLQASLQGPTGWDLLVRLVRARIKSSKKKKKIGTHTEQGKQEAIGKSSSLPVHIYVQSDESVESQHFTRHFSV